MSEEKEHKGPVVIDLSGMCLLHPNPNRETRYTRGQPVFSDVPEKVCKNLSGDFGKFWEMHVEDKTDPRMAAWVGGWTLFAPSYHLMWYWYMIGLVALRDVPGVDKAKKVSENMTHELMIFALDPMVDRRVQVNKRQDFYRLEPVNVVAQFEAKSDAEAREKVETLLKMIGRGHFSPDSDFRSHWRLALSKPLNINTTTH